MWTRAFSIGLCLGLASTPVLSEPLGIVSELKFGILAHDVPIIAADNIEGGVDLNAEVLFVRLSPKSWNFRPHIGVQSSSTGDTSQVYAGFTTTHYLTDNIWGAFSGGGTIHNGETSRFGKRRKAFGSRVLFRLALELGLDVTEHASVSLYYDHESNAFLVDENPGIDNVGVRLRWKF
jgi:hypothetical protein